MSSDLTKDDRKSDVASEVAQTEPDPIYDSDAEFGGHEARKMMEKKLLRKLDAR